MAAAATSATDYGSEWEVPTANFDGSSFTTQQRRGQLVDTDGKSAPTPNTAAAVEYHGNEQTQHYKIIIVGESGLGKTTATNCLLHDLMKDTPGLKWEEVAPEEVTTATEVINPELASALQLKLEVQGKLEFTGIQFDCFNASNVSYNCYMKVNNKCVKPVRHNPFSPTVRAADSMTEACSDDCEKTITITTSEPYEVRSSKVGERVWLRIVDTPGYGDNLDATHDFRQIKDFITHQYEARYKVDQYENMNVNKHTSDNLITCCLYFIAPHRIKGNDIAFMREISQMVNSQTQPLHRVCCCTMCASQFVSI